MRYKMAISFNRDLASLSMDSLLRLSLKENSRRRRRDTPLLSTRRLRNVSPSITAMLLSSMAIAEAVRGVSIMGAISPK